MRGKSLLVLALVVLAFGAYIALVEPRLDTTDERRERAGKVLDLDVDTVSALRIEHEGETLELRRRPADASDQGGDDGALASGDADTAWHIEQPIQTRADSLSVDGLIRDLAGLDKERTLGDVDRRAAGLDKPRATITLQTDEGDILLTIGPEVPGTDSMLMAMGDGEPVVQVPARVFERLAKPAGEWRDKALFDAGREAIRHLRLAHGVSAVELAREGEGFVLTAPIADRADAAQVNALLGQISGLRAERFVDDPSEAVAADGSAGTITVTIEGREQPFVIALGALETNQADNPPDAVEPATNPTRYADVDGQAVTVGSDWQRFFADAAFWRDRRLSRFQVFSLAEAAFEDAAGSVLLTRVDSDWRRDGEPIDYATASDLLYAVADLEAAAILDPDTPEASVDLAGRPRIAVDLADEEGSRERLTLVSLEDGRWHATAGGRDAVLLLGAEDGDQVAARLEAVRTAEAQADEAPAADADASSGDEAPADETLEAGPRPDGIG